MSMQNIMTANGLSGASAHRLIQTGGQTNCLRPWLDDKGNGFITVNDAHGVAHNVPTNNAVLRKDEWEEFDREVQKATRLRLQGVSLLMRQSLFKRIPAGLGKTTFSYDRGNDLDAAELSMSGVAKSKADRQQFDNVGVPLPIAHKDFQISARTQMASASMGAEPLDSSGAESAGYRVGELIENTLYNGSSIVLAGFNLQGLTTKTGRNTGSLSVGWTATGATGATIVADVLAMIQAAIDDGFYGPYDLHLPVEYTTKLDEDYSSVKGDGTIRERLMKIETLSEIVHSSKLATDNVVLHQATTDVVRMIDTLTPQVLQWETDGGMLLNFKAMAINVPDIRVDVNGKCGVVHYTA